MKKALLAFLVLVLCPGQSCFVVPPPTDDAPNQQDISNWDFTPCLESWESFDTCKSLLMSNQEVITGGHTYLEVLFYNLEEQVQPTSQPAG